MRTFKPEAWLPTTKKEVEAREWDYIDVILFSGDAYVDHPSFGAAVIGRTLEAMGLRVAIVPQPDWRGDYRDFKKLGAPRLFFGVSAGAMDSMINHYTANKRLRSIRRYRGFPAPSHALRLLAGKAAPRNPERQPGGFTDIRHGRTSPERTGQSVTSRNSLP